MNRNVVLVTVDSLRADHCGFAGYDRETTPALDRLAREGLVFEHAVAPGPKTPASLPAMVTGRFPPAPSQGPFGREGWREFTRPHVAAHRTIAERFSAAGYDTGAFVPNPFASRSYGYDAGFDRFEDFLGEDRQRRLFDTLLDVAGVPFARSAVDWALSERSFRTWETYYDDVVSWVERADRPYFLWVFLMDVHTPYLAPRAFRERVSLAECVRTMIAFRRTDYEERLPPSHHRRLVDAYDDCVGYADEFVRRLVADTADSDPVVAVTADHGDAFFEHGSYYHRRTLYEENVHVPLVVARAGESGRVDRPTSLATLPRLLARAAADEPLADPPPGRPGPAVARSYEAGRTAVRGRRYKLLFADGEPEAAFDLARDPGEQSPTTVPPAASALADRLWRRHEATDREQRAVAETAAALADGGRRL
jgi:arylsulfatase